MREFVSDERVAQYVAARTGISLTSGQHTQLGIIQGGVVTCGVVFTHYSGHDISMTAAGSPGAFTKVFLIRLGEYAYGELSCSRITILTEQPSVVAKTLRLGAQIEGVKRDQFGPGRDATMLGLLASEWPFTKRSGSDPLPDRSDMNGIRSRRSRS